MSVTKQTLWWLIGLWLSVSPALIEMSPSLDDKFMHCDLYGIYKGRQSVLLSPHYPYKYPANICWDYIVRSPYRCPTKFHVQFLDFHLEESPNCSNDYLAIFPDSHGDNVDILCGKVTGIKKYSTSDGVLRLRFVADDSPWTTEMGFKLLLTRLTCEDDVAVDDDLEPSDLETSSQPLVLTLQPPFRTHPPFFQHFNNEQKIQHYTVDLPNLNQELLNSPSQLQTPVPGIHYIQPKSLQSRLNSAEQSVVVGLPINITQLPPVAQLLQVDSQYFVPKRHLHLPDNNIFNHISPSESCCLESFNQKHFYLSSPGFPLNIDLSVPTLQQYDCNFQIVKSSPYVCRLRVEFKFFNFGKFFGTTVTGEDICSENFLEIDGLRFCGCRTGSVHIAYWPINSPKLLRVRSGYSRLPLPGFLLNIYQENCELLLANNVAEIQSLYPPWIRLPLNSQQLPSSARDLHIVDVVKSQSSPEPFSVIETNVTRKEFYYHDADEGLPLATAAENRERSQCSFYGDDMLQLYSDDLWQTKPICNRPWIGNNVPFI